MFSRRNRTSVWVLLALLSFLVSNAEAQARKQFTMAVSGNIMSWFPVHVAQKKGFLREQGLELLPIVIVPRISVTALATREIDYGTPLGSIVTGAARGLPIKITMALSTSTAHVLVARPEIASVRDLRGMTIAINQSGNALHRGLDILLKKSGVDPKEVQVIPIAGGHMLRSTALTTGHVDAIWTSFPYDLPLEKAGYRRLAHLKDIIDVPGTGLGTHVDRIRTHTDEIRGLTRAVLKGIAYTKSHRDEVLPLVREFIGLDSLEMAGKTFDVYKPLWPDNGLVSDEALRNVLDVGTVSQTVPVDKVADWSILKETLKSLKMNY